ncbi:hypothetical protein [Comamonas sp.]|uniref:hypothetical protein n=1 Tax=Comamonas sp. TaxID=34028 RepID=UPI00258DD4B5|nr:hypothetical protein [Comamonas sp.]
MASNTRKTWTYRFKSPLDGRMRQVAMGQWPAMSYPAALGKWDALKRTAQIEYESDTWERANPFLVQLWNQLGGTPDTLDDAFRLAATL